MIVAWLIYACVCIIPGGYSVNISMVNSLEFISVALAECADVNGVQFEFRIAGS